MSRVVSSTNNGILVRQQAALYYGTTEFMEPLILETTLLMSTDWELGTHQENWDKKKISHKQGLARFRMHDPVSRQVTTSDATLDLLPTPNSFI